MPDISMCMDKTCPTNKTCYRYMAKPNPYAQSYFVGSPRKDDQCDHYWKMKKNDKRTVWFCKGMGHCVFPMSDKIKWRLKAKKED